MWGSVFVETLRQGWRTALYWTIGMGMIASIVVLFINDASVLQQYAQLMESMPPFLLSMFGGADIEFMATPDGYLATRYFSFIMLFFAFYAVTAGMNITANDEDAGIMDMFMSLPVRRWQVVLEKTLAYAVLVSAIILITMLLQVASVAAVPDVGFTVGRVIESNLNLLPSLLVVLAVSGLLGAVIRRKSTALALSALFVVGSYMVDVFAAAMPDLLAAIKPASFFSYIAATDVMKTGLIPGNIALLLGVAVVALVAAMWRYERRDIGM
ncbi:MAG: ABC transporter permease [Pleurocapsa minor GSE-CHR-MK-17-07R]|jgi:ABC-type transport system involved in multi-copper enzyme maturation permease subunit|nr:ABC transporter permease [Pleurocapsa minor GSE-CHR-MK 17-07R]